MDFKDYENQESIWMDERLKFWITGFVMSIGFSMVSGLLAFSAIVVGSPIVGYFTRLAGVMVASTALTLLLSYKRFSVLKSKSEG